MLSIPPRFGVRVLRGDVDGGRAREDGDPNDREGDPNDVMEG